MHLFHQELLGLFSILFFVSGQVALKYENSKNSLISCCYFTISMGIVGLLTLLFLDFSHLLIVLTH